jgi:hypothetical protein
MAAESSLEKIEAALRERAPTIEPGKRVTCPELIDPAMVFTGRRLAYLVSQSLDGFCELFVRERDGQVPCWLLRHERWHVIAKVVGLLENNHIASMQTSDPIALRNRSDKVDTVVDPLTC